MKDNLFREVVSLLEELNSDDCAPKNLKLKIKEIQTALICEECSTSIRVDRSLQRLDDLNEDTNIPIHIKTQLWDIVCKLESIPQ
jgi:uncharacterized protein